jgi:hypothetical protein
MHLAAVDCSFQDRNNIVTMNTPRFMKALNHIRPQVPAQGGPAYCIGSISFSGAGARSGLTRCRL